MSENWILEIDTIIAQLQNGLRRRYLSATTRQRIKSLINYAKKHRNSSDPIFLESLQFTLEAERKSLLGNATPKRQEPTPAPVRVASITRTELTEDDLEDVKTALRACNTALRSDSKKMKELAITLLEDLPLWLLC